MKRLVLIFLLTLAFSPLTQGEEKKEIYPQLAEVTAKTLSVVSTEKAKTPFATLSEKNKVVILEERGRIFRIAFPYFQTVQVPKKSLLIRGNRGVVTSNATAVFKKEGTEKPFGHLHRGDRVRIVKISQSICFVKTTHLVVTGFVPKQSLALASRSIPERWQATVIPEMKNTAKEALNRKIASLKRKLKAELSKSLEEMNLKAFIADCTELEKDTENVRVRSLVEFYRKKASAMEEMRKSYLKLTDPLRKDIKDNLEH